MPRDVLTSADLLGRIDTVTVECVKCDRRGRYRVRTLVREIGLDGNIASSLSGLPADCPRKKSASLSDRCDLRCPDLLRLAQRSEP
jgi:hypothetical protein